MVRLPLDDGARPIDLFREDQPYHLVGKCHSRQGDLLVCPLVNSLGKAIRTADDEDQAPCRLLLSLKPFRKFHASELRSMLIHEDNRIRRLQLVEDQFSFPRLLLFLTEIFRVLDVRDGDDRKWHIMPYALNIVVDACHEMLVRSFSYQQ